MKLEPLSEKQQKIYDLLSQGKSIKQIATKLGSDESLVSANITRIKTKGYPIPTGDAPPNSPPTVSQQPFVPPDRYQPTGPGSRQEASRMVDAAADAGPAEGLPPGLESRFASPTPDGHPVVLFGTCVQFVHLAGGRLAAHELINQTEGALQAAAGRPNGAFEVPPSVMEGIGKVRPDAVAVVMLGVAVAFVKAAGGVRNAHQLIEDVYATLKLFVGEPGQSRQAC